jgi:Leucine-rich repeat (LRR) protein
LLRLPAVEDNAAMEAEPPKADRPKRKRRWFQFSLRSLLLLTLLVGIGMAIWIVPIKTRAERQKRAIEAIVNDGGLVTYDYEENQPANRSGDVKNEPPGPGWLRKLLGDDYFANVVTVRPRTDAGMRELSGLNHLRGLIRPYNDRFTSMNSKGQRISHIDATQITDLGLKQLRELNELQYVDLSDTGITDAGLDSFKDKSQLQMLNLSGDQITDAGLKDLHGSSQLKKLVLKGTRITDAGLEHLKELTALRELWLNETNVTDAGVSELQKALPNCKIEH